MNLTSTLPRVLALGLALPLYSCADDTGSNDDSTPSTTTATATTGDPTTDPTGSPTPTSGTTGVETGDPDTSGDGPATTSGNPTDTTEGGDSSGGGGATMWALEVDVDLGGAFPVTADATITVMDAAFDSDVLTILIAGGAEEHMIPLAGTVAGDTLTMTDSMFSLDLGGTPEDVSVSGTATLTADSLTGSGTFTTAIDGGRPFPGTWAITNAVMQ